MNVTLVNIPDPMGQWLPPRPCCAVADEWWCTRPDGHTGRHAASTGATIVAVWGDR